VERWPGASSHRSAARTESNASRVNST
jgi:hypothetical protein